MSNTGLKPKGHYSAASLDTNASGLAESTISLGLSRFPEPPSSIPSTPLRSEFGGGTPTPTRTTFNIPSAQHYSPLRKTTPLAGPSNTSTSFTHFANRGPSFNPIPASTSSTLHTGVATQPSTSSQALSPYDWHDGASSIDVDAREDRLLPTSFITSLLQENKDSRTSQRTSYASDAISGISEMTYPPIRNQSDADNMISARYSSGRVLPYHIPQDSRQPPSSYSQVAKPSNRTSGDSETLHSSQEYPPIIGTASLSQGVRVPGASVVGVAPATLRTFSVSGTSNASSGMDTDTLRSTDKVFQRRLSTTFEAGNELTVDYKSFDPYSPALPSTAGTRGRFFRESLRPDPEFRNSSHSNKSAAPTFISRISGISLRHVFGWRKVKPLPPVPIIPHIPLSMENAHRLQDQTTPLPDLVNRAGNLRELLEKGHYPHQSYNSYHVFPDPSSTSYNTYEAEVRKLGLPETRPMMAQRNPPIHNDPPPSSHRPATAKISVPKTRKRTCLIIGVILVAAIAAIGAGVGATVGRKKKSQFNCSGNFTGAACALDASCVCTSSARCDPLAKSIIDLLPVVNQQFTTNITSTSAYNNIWMMQGSPTGVNCASQALLVDVGNKLQQQAFPNRTQWAQAAMLWNAIQTQDMDASESMQQFVQNVPWEKLNDMDGPVSNQEAAFSTTVSGFTFNLASQTVTQPSASFVTLGQPSNAQIARVSSEAQTTLDRMYSFAQASATQRQNALKKYWSSVLLQRPEDLAVFKTAISVSPIMLTFNASSRPIRNLYSTSSSPFPPPLGCFPGLSNPVQQQINSIETGVFGLQQVASTAQFDPSCYRARPVYGVLDVLRLRLPFLDSTGALMQAAILSRDANSRVILYNGEIFSGTIIGTTNITSSQLDARHYGTSSLLDHVVLQYLSSIPDMSIANALVRFVLDSATSTTQVAVPPDISTALFRSIQSIPTIEVAVFGDVGPPDLTSTVASFTTSSGSLFFGSDDGTAFRNWTINSISGSVIWAENATSPQVVRDNSLGNTPITQTWNAIALAIANNIKGIGLSNITTTLQGTQNFSP
ncbi:hypothetical protein B0H34DRAFT_41501 [Crassisporium funariophilum]|nr:hypothetical protein B0H34DRAFT_41501 [Crassisporium funariophilum]